MKKRILSSIALGMLSLFAFAQKKDGDFKFGAKAGLNISTISISKTSSRANFALGVYGQYKLTDELTLQPEVLYSRQGAKLKLNRNDIPSNVIDQVRENLPDGLEKLLEGPFKISSTYKIDYIIIPIMLKYKLVDGLHVEAGPQFGLVVNKEYKSKLASLPENTVSLKSGINNFDFGLNLGLSYDVLDTGLSVNARYNLGLTNVFKGGDSKNRVFFVGLGYTF